MEIHSHYFCFNGKDYFYIRVEEGIESIKDCQVFQSFIKSLTGPGRRIVMDFTRCRFLTGSSIGFLVAAVESIREAGGEAVIAAIQGEVRMLLDLVGTSQVVSIISEPPHGKEEFESAFRAVGKL